MAKGYTKFYLSQPVTIKETMKEMATCPSLREVTWRQKDVGKHYSPSVPTISWRGREGHVFRFEMGAQWETNETSLLIFGVAVDRAETSLDRSGSSSLHVAPEIGPNGIT